MRHASDRLHPSHVRPADHSHTRDDGSWWLKDGYGIPLCRVCDVCEDAKLERYRPDILTAYDSDERVEADY